MSRRSWSSLGYELQQRGHRVTVFGVPDAQPKTVAAGLDFCAIAESEFPLGITTKSLAQLGKLSGFAALRYTINLIRQSADVLLRDAPGAIEEAGVDALLVDQISPGGGTVADFLGIPFITVCSALLINQEDSVPPMFTTWNYNPVWWARLRNRAGTDSRLLQKECI